MTSDFTEHQSDDEKSNARRLSVEPTRPPAKIEGYNIQSFVGRGSYGEVWSAIDQKTGKRVAIKFYAQRSSADVKQLAQEVEKLVVLAADRHVVQLLDVGWHASPPYYVMDYIEFGSLEDQIKSGEPMPVARAVEVFREVAVGLMHLHGKGILHCDLKPGNVLLDQDGKPRLADFGQSRLSTDDTAALGTLFYMAPEQADLKSVPDAKWDVYGLGALLFTMLTGKPPYYSDELKQQIESSESLKERLKTYRHALNGSPRPKSHRVLPGVDRSLADIIDRCIESKPSKRLESAQSVLNALKQRDVKQLNRPLILLGILGPIILLLLMSVFGWFAFRQATSDAEEAIIAKAHESNTFAAQLAARSAAEQLDEYFRVVRQMARDQQFRSTLTSVLADEQLTQMRTQLSDPNQNSAQELFELRSQFRSHPVRKKLQPFLRHLLDDPDGEFPESASWFVTDRFGNQIAAVFEEGSGVTIGKNYSYRTYFTGEPEDLTADEKENAGKKYTVDANPENRKIIQSPHLSASFPSEQSGLRKVAFSSPVCNEEQEIIGLIAVTANVGNLVDFKASEEQYVMLVDDRKDKNRRSQGIILEHPIYLQFRGDHSEAGSSKPVPIPEPLTEVRVNVSAAANPDEGYSRDPFGETDFGEPYRYQYIIASAEVGKQSEESVDETRSPHHSEITGDSGIFVLALERYDSILEPSRQLSNRLGRLASLAFLIMLSVAIGMWLLVKRIFRQSRRHLSGTIEGENVGTIGSSSLPTASATGATTRATEN